MMVSTLRALMLLMQAASTTPVASRQSRPVLPALAFPEPGMDDTAAYQGYQTRFYRDSRGNTVQVYLDGRSGRVVQLWADAADESVGLTVRDSAGRPAPLTWGSDGAVVSDSGSTRTITYTLTTTTPRIDIGWLLLGSMRVERDFQYARHHLEPFTAPPFRQQELVALIDNLGQLAPAEQRRELALLHAGSVRELTGRIRPMVTQRCTDTTCVVRAVQPTFDGRNHLVLELRTDSRRTTMRSTERVISVRSRAAAPIRVTITVATDAAPLTPLDRDEIFNSEFLRFLAAARDTALQVLGPGSTMTSADSATVMRYRWLEREVRSVELLSSEEKLMAGMPNYATYFGRDMMMSALMMQPIWRGTMSEHVIASALRKLSPRGDVSHEEALGGQAIREHAGAYNALIADSLPLARRRGQKAADSVLEQARGELRDLHVVRENYHMMDDEFQLVVLAARYLEDETIPAERKRTFLLAMASPADTVSPDSTSPDTTPPGATVLGATCCARTSRLALLLRELSLVTSETAPYARDPEAGNLIAFEKLDSTHWRSASWRDSQDGYANGRFAMDINVIWAPHALESIARILTVLHELGFTDAALDSLALPEAEHTPLGRYLHDPAQARRDGAVWKGARRYFTVTLAPPQIEARVSAKLAWLPPDERRYWRQVIASHPGIDDSLTFLALSLDSAGRPIPVVNTDPATGLFLGDMTTELLRDSLSLERALREIDVFVRPYPVGLFVDGLGPLVANDSYAPRTVWEAFRRDPYHSPRVVWGREVNLLLLGLARQLAAARDGEGQLERPVPAPYVHALESALRRVDSAVRASGFKHAELWSYQIERGRLVPVRYGTSSDIQLWSSTDLAVQFMLSRLGRE